jgi:carotenoid cleavage dioxygenase
MIHDFGVTEKHIMFFVIPMATSMDNIREGKVHFAWDSSLPCYVGVIPRGGDGKDVRWFKGPTYMCTHTMGNWTDGQKVYFDQDGGEGNQFPFFPSRNPADTFSPAKSAGRVRRFVMDLSTKGDALYSVETMYPHVTGALARQDDRYHTVPYRYGFLNGRDNNTGAAGWACFDHQTNTAKVFSLGPDTRLQEMCFVPRKKGAPEGDGYLIGVANRLKENGRSDLVLVDTKHLDDGPVATVKLPYRIPDQVHGFWAPGDQLPKPKAPQARA